MKRRWLVIAALGAAATAQAAPSVDTVLCQRFDQRFGKKQAYLSIEHPAAAPKVEVFDRGKVTVCNADRSCTTFIANGWHADDPAVTYVANADATLLLAGSNKGLEVEDAATGKRKRKITSRRRGTNGGGAMYSCGGGLWLGEAILAFGSDCQEADALPYLANGRTGKFIAPLVNRKLTADDETLYDAARLGDRLWAVAMYNHNIGPEDLGAVFVIDVTSGRVLATASSTQDGSANITEGKATRSIAKLATCAR
ncbi:MAG TPA: hypothetical protein VHW23_18740 [Kofleriaceae bacterium]|jgi:hypothetical protein|nr:hypothetical protein [Kofleriaceae bacterium]